MRETRIRFHFTTPIAPTTWVFVAPPSVVVSLVMVLVASTLVVAMFLAILILVVVLTSPHF